jgi:hypothetical protein
MIWGCGISAAHIQAIFPASFTDQCMKIPSGVSLILYYTDIQSSGGPAAAHNLFITGLQ